MGLRENILHQSVRDLAVRPLIIVNDGDTVRDIVQRMREIQLGAAVSVDEAGRPVAMFNEKLLIRMLTNKPAALDEPVIDHMTHNVICVKEDDTIATLIATMQERKLRWVCVVDESGKAIALTGLRGAMEYVVDHFPRRVLVQPVKSKLAMDEREGA